MRVGEVRPSAAVSQFGIGSVIDLPHLSVVVCGLDRWPVDLARDAIDEPRLVAAIQQAIPTVTALVRPPRSPGDDGGRVRARTTVDAVGLPVLAFPRWLVCPRCRRLASLDSGLFLLKANRFAPHRTAYVHEACPKIGRGGRRSCTRCDSSRCASTATSTTFPGTRSSTVVPRRPVQAASPCATRVRAARPPRCGPTATSAARPTRWRRPSATRTDARCPPARAATHTSAPRRSARTRAACAPCCSAPRTRGSRRSARRSHGVCR